MSRNLWQQRYADKNFPRPVYDGWLDPYQDFFESPDLVLLDVGVGLAPNLDHYGSVQRRNVHAFDFSALAIKLLREREPEVQCFVHDVTRRMPLGADVIDRVVADLSLHYFSSDKTRSAIEELYRVTRPGGLCFVRVNRAGDQDSGYGQGIELEPDYFQLTNNRKRFFSQDSLKAFFRGWETVELKDSETRKYGFPKQCVVGVFRKRD